MKENWQIPRSAVPPAMNASPGGFWVLQSSIKVKDCKIILQFLFTKFIRNKLLTENEVLLIFNAYYTLSMARSQKGKNLNETTICFLETISLFINEFYSPTTCQERLWQYIKDLNHYYPQLLISPRRFLGLERDINFHLLFLKWKFIEPKAPKESSRIGVGYRDKGNRRNLSISGDLFVIEELAGDETFKDENWFKEEPNFDREQKFILKRVQRNLERPGRVTRRQRKLYREVKSETAKNLEEREYFGMLSDVLW